jgi:hypothetical protein
MKRSLKIVETNILLIYSRSCAVKQPTSLCTDDKTADQLWELSAAAVGL